jgi:hypothetical protein
MKHFSDFNLSEDTFRNPEKKPDWAQLTRLGGDRVAILFEDLRRRIGAIDGLVEDLHFANQQDGWAPRYSVGGVAIAEVRIAPGRLEAALEGDVADEKGKESGGRAERRELKNRAAVASFARQVIRASKSAAEKIKSKN